MALLSDWEISQSRKNLFWTFSDVTSSKRLVEEGVKTETVSQSPRLTKLEVKANEKIFPDFFIVFFANEICSLVEFQSASRWLKD